MKPLADRVYECLQLENGPRMCAFTLPGRLNWPHGTNERDYEIATFGACLGVAFTLARLDNPFAAEKDLEAIAAPAALEAYERECVRPAQAEEVAA